VDVIILLVFISLILVGAALAFFRSRLRDGDLDHGDRLSLLPLLDDDGRGRSGRGAGTAHAASSRAGERSAAATTDPEPSGPHAAKEKGMAYESRQ
jgi:hypothetical protein